MQNRIAVIKRMEEVDFDEHGNVKEPSGWTTTDETKFLDGLGNYSPGTKETREVLLHHYEHALDKRQKFGRIEKHLVLVHVAKLRGRVE